MTFFPSWINGHEEEYGFGFKALMCHDGVFDTTYNGFSTDELFFVCESCLHSLYVLLMPLSSLTTILAGRHGRLKQRRSKKIMLGGRKTCSFLYRFNPSKFVGQWKTPQLLIHGGRDYRLPETESIGAFHALQQCAYSSTQWHMDLTFRYRRGIPSRFLYFPDENHWVLHPENSLKWHHEVFKWFEEFVGEWRV
jgi:hypothetical protein